jgi:hypothetical protein
VSKSSKNSSRSSYPAVQSLFYGYSTHCIMLWCGVSKNTACAWKKGTRRASKRAIKLFQLHRRGKILTDEFRNWKINVKTGYLVSPTGREWRPGDIEALPYLHQLISALRVDLRLKERKIEELEIQLDPAAHEQVLIDTSKNVVRLRK